MANVDDDDVELDDDDIEEISVEWLSAMKVNELLRNENLTEPFKEMIREARAKLAKRDKSFLKNAELRLMGPDGKSIVITAGSGTNVLTAQIDGKGDFSCKWNTSGWLEAAFNFFKKVVNFVYNAAKHVLALPFNPKPAITMS